VTLEVVKDCHVDEDEEDSEARDHRGHAVLLCQGFVRLLASVGHEDSCILVLALVSDGSGINNVIDI
jgi:hypothetical protein